jgi:4-hydroxybenzoate polyprenyltransferase
MNCPKEKTFIQSYSEVRLTKMRGFIGNLIAITRAYEWMDKLQVNFLAAFLVVILFTQWADFFFFLLIYCIYQLFLISYGYVINSYADREDDLKAGKHREITYVPNGHLFLIIGFLAVGSLGIPLFFNTKIKILGVITFLLATFYSLKPIRFKERGLLGILVPALTQRSLLFLFFALLVSSSTLIDLYLFIWLALIGIIIIMAHQLMDFDNDKKTGTHTWAIAVGIKRAKKYTSYTSKFTILYLIIPISILPVPTGLVISIVLASFTYHSLSYAHDALRT